MAYTRYRVKGLSLLGSTSSENPKRREIFERLEIYSMELNNELNGNKTMQV